jgi:hypothetical protein
MLKIETILITIRYKSLNVKYNVMQGVRIENKYHLSKVVFSFKLTPWDRRVRLKRKPREMKNKG